MVCDAGPIIHLDELGCLNLMRDFKIVIVPDVVRKEVLKHRKIVFESSDINWTYSSSKYVLEEPYRTMCRVFALDAGEMAALEVLGRDPDLILLTDDAAARLAVTNLGSRVHGTIGVLIRSIRRQLMKPSEVIEILKSVPQVSSLHIRPGILQRVISSVQDELNI